MGNEFAASAKQWQEDGWCVFEGLVPEADIDAAQDDLDRLYGGDTFADYNQAAAFRDFDPPEGKSFRGRQFDGIRGFPFAGTGALNDLFVHPRLTAFAEVAMEEHDLRIYQAAVWHKRAGEVNYEQPLHHDNNHSILPKRMEPGFWHLEAFLFLSDVDEDCAPPRLVPRSAAIDGRRYEDLYEHEVAATGKRGSLVAYRSDVWHRGTDFGRPDASRTVMVISYRPAAAEWYGYDAFGRLGGDATWGSFVAGKTPEELALFGVPRPGHRFWTAETVDGMERNYNGLDVSPWRNEL